MARKPIPRLPIELPAFDKVEPEDLPAVRRGWDLAHRKPGKGADLVNLASDRPRLVAQALGARAALTTLGRCLHCGRALRDRVSVERGVGPDCWADGYRPPGYVEP